MPKFVWLVVLRLTFTAFADDLATQHADNETCDNSISEGASLVQLRVLAAKEYINTGRLNFMGGDSMGGDSLKDAKFLIQSTFGPMRREMETMAGSTYEQWIVNQMRLEPESHRAYYRERVNPRLDPQGFDTVVGKARKPCDAGARWEAFSFSRTDVGRTVSVKDYKVYVDDELRTEIDPDFVGNQLSNPTSCSDEKPSSWNRRRTCRLKSRKMIGFCSGDWFKRNRFCRKSCFDIGFGYEGDDCSVGWPNMEFTGFICNVEDAVGAAVILSLTKSCSRSLKSMLNPAVWFAGKIPNAEFGYEYAIVRPGVLVMKKVPSSCVESNTLQIHAERHGQVYRHEPRLELVDNMNPQNDGRERRSTVPRTFVNKDSCELVKGHGINIESALITLDADTFATFHEVAGLYVYSVTGLRVDVSPCGTLSRWKELQCSDVPCQATAHSTELEAALGEEEDQGSFRDVEVACTQVPAGAVVHVQGQGFFQHVHLNEGNVYDFSDWVTKHPGGGAKIKKWTTLGFVLRFPQSHPMLRWESGTAAESLGKRYIGRVGDTMDFLDLPQNLQSHELAQVLGALNENADLTISCLSPGEAGNRPELGHQIMMVTAFEGRYKYKDTRIEVPMMKFGGKHEAGFRQPAVVWTNIALHANDQLRQRVAWALSQIFVVGTPSFGFDLYSEMWINFYDIFHRNAFRNFGDILAEVTYSPMMGEYLTYLRNRAFDSFKRFPDENYAREVMQLFTIGLWELNDDGSKMLVDGEPVPTYNNDNIMNFARVFTGFDERPTRTNIEKVRGADNLIDPMRIHASWRDVYPKPDLRGQFLGDGLPVCSDLKPLNFLAAGAKFEYIGQGSGSNGVHEVSPGSGLFQALCGPDGLGNCDFKLEVKLDSELKCAGEAECSLDNPKIFQVDGHRYRYTPPKCVHLFFFNGQKIRAGGKCVNPDAWSAGTACCDARRKNRQMICNHPMERVRFATAKARCESRGLKVCSHKPQDVCSLKNQLWRPDSCSVDVQVSDDGKVSSMQTHTTKQNAFAVHWQSGRFPVQEKDGSCPSGCKADRDACVCKATVENHALFTTVPSLQEATRRLRLGAFPPSMSCTHNCNGDVSAYVIGNAIDADTVFKMKGRYYMNQESVVRVAEKFVFRNPPVFMHPENFQTEQEAVAEVDALLDHLLHHRNTAPFICYRLIQRLVTSNPSPSYVRDVVKAFRSGAYKNMVFSGAYGDLSATVAATLLHPEARDLSHNTAGALREPLVKVLHYMRAMELTDNTAAGRRQILMRGFSSKLGQNAYESPSVFNFFLPDYRPDRLAEGLVAPEFQIFTPPTAVGFLNGMVSLVRNGLSSCSEGFGPPRLTCSDPDVALNFAAKGNSEDTLKELDVLLTGGRLPSLDILRKAYENPGEGRTALQAAQELVVLTPEFNTMGTNTPQGVRAPIPAPQPRDPRSYRAVVMLFLAGGADTFNMIVPMNCPLYDEYVAVRQSVALIPDQLHKVSTRGQKCTDFGIHHRLGFLEELYSKGQAAFVSNVGSLVEPMTNQQFKKGGARRCSGLFSHADAQQGAQTLVCQVSGSSPKGAGGRMADALANGYGKYRTSSFSVFGKKVWSEGFHTRSDVVDDVRGVPRFTEYKTFKSAIENITASQHGNAIAEEYALSLKDAIDVSEKFGSMLEKVDLKTNYPGSGKLSRQFRQVARLIATRHERKAERDIFFVSLGGFDTHRTVGEILDEKFTEVNTALKEFVAEMEAQKTWKDVAIVTHSDFGRTLTPNSGEGTDHAWAGNHFVVGGAVGGGTVFNTFPDSLRQGNEQDAGRGRLVPKFPWESMMVPIAEWMGASQSQLAEIFPNLKNFNVSDHIIPRTTLFE